MKMLKFVLPFAIFLMMIALPALVIAQGPGDPGCSPDDPCPIDGGLSLLIAAGVGIAAKRSYDLKKKKEAFATL